MGQQPWELRRQGRHAPGELTAREIQAITRSTAAKLVITRRRIGQKGITSADRNTHQQEINQCIADGTVDLHQRVSQAECIASVMDDLRDLQAEGLRITSTVH